MESNRIFHRICADEVAELMRNPELQILDTRDRTSFDQGHIVSARHVTGAELDRAILQTPKHKPVLIYCHRGTASLIHAQMFADFGFREVYNLNGGYEGWMRMQSAGQQSDSSTPRQSERLRAPGWPTRAFHPKIKVRRALAEIGTAIGQVRAFVAMTVNQ